MARYVIQVALKKKDLLTVGIQQTLMKLEFGRSGCGCSCIEGWSWVSYWPVQAWVSIKREKTTPPPSLKEDKMRQRCTVGRWQTLAATHCTSVVVDANPGSMSSQWLWWLQTHMALWATPRSSISNGAQESGSTCLPFQTKAAKPETQQYSRSHLQENPQGLACGKLLPFNVR